MVTLYRIDRLAQKNLFWMAANLMNAMTLFDSSNASLTVMEFPVQFADLRPRAKRRTMLRMRIDGLSFP
jgi:hypothetical protein